MGHRSWIARILALTLALIPSVAVAEDGLTVEVTTAVSCDQATFEVNASGGSIPYTLSWDFGDAETLLKEGVVAMPDQTVHQYPGQGSYSWALSVSDAAMLQGQADGAVVVDGPLVTLGSDPFPPLVTLEAGEASIAFTAEVVGGVAPYGFTWDLDGDGSSDADSNPASSVASFIYTAGGSYTATVRVQDDCGLVHEDTLLVVVIDPEKEPCHPTAQKIADAVNSLFPRQADSLYTCEDIYRIFRGGLTGSQVGFGRMWHAYTLAMTMEELTWEEIRDWHLDANGWGILTQLDRFSAALAEVGLRDLFDLVVSGDASISDIRSAARAAVRYDADFEDALARTAAGASPGELGRFYRTAQSLEIDAQTLDGYLAAGLSLTELQHAARVAERTGADWAEIALAHGSGHNWGEIGQAQRLADGASSWQDILNTGLRDYRSLLRDEARFQRQDGQSLRFAERLAERYALDPSEVMAMYEGDCARNWRCVRSELRSTDMGAKVTDADRDQRTAVRLASQYGVPEQQVWSLHDGTCAGDWRCVRAALRDQAGVGRGRGGKPED